MTDAVSRPAYRIQTQRLILRCWDPTDAPLLATAIAESLEHLKPWTPWAHNEPQDLQQRVNLLRKFRAEFDQDEHFAYGIFNQDESLVIGGTGLIPRVGKDAIEIGYWIHVDYVNQGYATEVSAALTKVAFAVMGLKRVEIHCDPRNVRSMAVPKKLGFVHEATLRQRLDDHEGQKQDQMIWSLLLDEYPNSPAAQAQVAAFDVMQQKIL
ncbi:GNAT family N-acetyltransferase [Leptodesmis sichuanensis]|uniref:GNAT family N-acetyltransferase n=1 Tax=Leptodesmis sichuanensis TaxID=2906798 RepID=UPI001F16479B|nr:GNAT family protein [Leptodesmis sichuanensis]UIE40156.1 GNAT family N-acetyltransferase [Leptodesmis sichuanensis A121]